MQFNQPDNGVLAFLRYHFPNFDKIEKLCFTMNQNAKDMLFAKYQLALEKSKTLPNLQGVLQKLITINSVEKLDSTLSELQIAICLAKNFHSVNLIPDNGELGWKESSPDIVIADNYFNSCIEVTKWTHDNSNQFIDLKLNSIALQKNLIIEYHLSQEISSLVVTREERTNREELFRSIIEQIVQYVNSLNGNELPLKKCFNNINIFINKAKQGQGYAINSFSESSLVPEDAYYQQILDRLNRKATNPRRWPNNKKGIPYFIAIDIEQIIGQYRIIPQVLYGGITFDRYQNLDGIPALDYPSIVEERIKSDWKEFILTIGYDSTRRHYINRLGFFLTNPDASLVNGVLIFHRQQLVFFPNPFADSSLSMDDYLKYLHIPIYGHNNIKPF